MLDLFYSLFTLYYICLYDKTFPKALLQFHFFLICGLNKTHYLKESMLQRHKARLHRDRNGQGGPTL